MSLAIGLTPKNLDECVKEMLAELEKPAEVKRMYPVPVSPHQAEFLKLHGKVAGVHFIVTNNIKGAL